MKVKNVDSLIRVLETLKGIGEKVSEAIEEKRNWMEERSDKWQNSDKYSEWDNYLDNLDDFISDVEDLEIPEE